MTIIDRGENCPKDQFRYLLRDKNGKNLDSSDSLFFVQMMYGPNLPVVIEEVSDVHH